MGTTAEQPPDPGNLRSVVKTMSLIDNFLGGEPRPGGSRVSSSRSSSSSGAQGPLQAPSHSCLNPCWSWSWSRSRGWSWSLKLHLGLCLLAECFLSGSAGSPGLKLFLSLPMPPGSLLHLSFPICCLGISPSQTPAHHRAHRRAEQPSEPALAVTVQCRALQHVAVPPRGPPFFLPIVYWQC